MADVARAMATSIKASGTCTAIVNGVETVILCARDLTVASGDALLIQKLGSEWVAIARLGTGTPAAVEAGPTVPPPRTPQSGSTLITPIETRSYRSGDWRDDNDDVYQGQYLGNGNHTGCVFYGNKPGSLSGVTVTSASIKVRRPDAGGMNAAQATTLWTISQSKKPAGAPTRLSSTSGPSLRRGETDNGFTIPTAFGQALVDGTAGGLAIFESDGSPYVILSGRSRWSAAFALTLNWTR